MTSLFVVSVYRATFLKAKHTMLSCCFFGAEEVRRLLRMCGGLS